MTVTYRAPRAEEADALALLARETFDEAFGHLYRRDDLAAFYAEWKTPDAFSRWIANPRIGICVAYDGGGAIGYAMTGEDIMLDYDPGERTALELKQLYIRAGYHGMGVAQTLMRWVEEQASRISADEIILSVYSENHRGLAFYAKHGFTKYADTTFLVGQQVDPEYLYRKTLA